MGNNTSNTLVKNASFLMMATLISRVIGLLYKSPLSTVVGNVGMGYYGYASQVYVILLLISSYSIPMAVSKVVSKHKGKEIGVLKKCLLFIPNNFIKVFFDFKEYSGQIL